MSERSGPGEDGTNIVKLTDHDAEEIRRLLKLLLDADERRPSEQPSSLPETELSVVARRIFTIRQKRLEHFPAAMFGELAWDMLLLLYITEGQQRLTVGAVAQFLRASRATASRWLDYLENKQFISRCRHPTDLRVMYVALTEAGTQAVEGFLSEISTLSG